MATDGETTPRGVLLDLDGTLYRQGPLRRRMLVELGRSVLTRAPHKSARTLRILSTFRKVREELRAEAPGAGLEELQYAEPARRLGVPSALVRATVEEWMHRRPLPFLLPHVRPGAAAFLAAVEARGLPTGIFSDYPVDAKLEALGLGAHAPFRYCATDPAVDAFKPHPNGFLHACEQWGLAPHEVLYVGDRVDVDGAGAEAAGMRFALLGDASTADSHDFESLVRWVGV